jgi:hypothetical protein
VRLVEFSAGALAEDMAFEQDLGPGIGEKAAAALDVDHRLHGGDVAADIVGSPVDGALTETGGRSGEFGHRSLPRAEGKHVCDRFCRQFPEGRFP